MSKPQTKAGKALLADMTDQSRRDVRLRYGWAAHEIAPRILAIEAEAREDAEHAERSTLDNTRELVRQYQGTIAALREDCQRLRSGLVEVIRLNPDSPGSHYAKHVLSDTASAATEERERIRAEAVAQERARVRTLVDNDPIYRSLDRRAARALLGEKEPE